MKDTSPREALGQVQQALKHLHKPFSLKKEKYYVPSLWVSPHEAPAAFQVDPFDFYHEVIKGVREGKGLQRGDSSGGEWSRHAIIYNMFVRTTSAFDHNRNGKLDLPVNEEGFRETGTFLKAIAMLPYLKRLGANTVHLLPITSIGHDGNKGTLGSPYAICNPYELDENQCEPRLGLDAKTEFKAFVEAAHTLGLRVVLEFVFRTAAKDGDWVKEHPEWLYWIREEVAGRDPHSLDEAKYGSPIFTREELEKIHRDVNEHRFGNLIPPHPVYIQFFTKPPVANKVIKEDGRYIGTLADGTRVKIPGAFADWPPDDTQPPWGDVTYLRLYEHPDFNYIAYNTIRMYDSRLAQPQNVNKRLWERIVGIIPYYQKEFSIDGVMIDMGHALPMELKAEIIKAARTIDPDFAFWDENFSIAQRSRDEGYNAVFGFLWVDEHHSSRMKTFFKHAASEGFPIPFFATPESHNTPRAAARPGGVAYSKWAFVVNAFLPGIPFIHSGFELAETYPINTGLDFTKEQLKHLPSEKLPLFSEHAYNWLSKDQICSFVARVLDIRKGYEELVTNPKPQTFLLMHSDNPHIHGFARVSESNDRRVAVLGSTNFDAVESGSVKLDTEKIQVTDLLTDRKIVVKSHHIHVTLHPGQCIVVEF